jgi:DNA replication protein DnaC
MAKVMSQPSKLAVDPEQRKANLDRHKKEAAIQQDLGPRYAPDRVRFDKFEVYHPAQRDVLDRLQAVADALPEYVSRGAGLILYGSVGTGKDHLLAAMLYQAVSRHGFPCRWANGQEIYGLFRDRMSTEQREADLLQKYEEPQVLAISDPIPPVGEPTAWNLSQLYRLLDRRYRHLKPTWVTLNARSIQDADTKLSASVFDRLREDAELFACFWPSFRERRKGLRG